MMLDKLYRKNFKTQCMVMYRYVNNYSVAEEIVQESYLKAVKYLESYDPNKSALRTWFNMIMFNTLRNYKNGDMTKDTYSVDDKGNLKDELPATQDFLCLQENFEFVQEEIGKVSSNSSAKILELYYLAGYRSDEISSALGIKQTAVTSCCSRFKQKLLREHN